MTSSNSVSRHGRFAIFAFFGFLMSEMPAAGFDLHQPRGVQTLKAALKSWMT